MGEFAEVRGGRLESGVRVRCVEARGRAQRGNMESGRLVLGGASATRQNAPDPVLLKNLVDMGFAEAEAQTALERTDNRSLEVAIDFIMNNPTPAGSGSAPAAAAHCTPALAPTPVPVLPDQEKIKSSFDIAAREAHKKREMEERTRVVREEQKRKKEHEKKVKQQLEEDKMLRKMKPVVARVNTLSVHELKEYAEAITTFLSQNGRACDELAELKTRLLAAIQTVEKTQGGSNSPAAAASHPAASPPASGGQETRPCQIRLRLADGSQVIQTLPSDATLQTLHDFVVERQGDVGFTFIVPGPPGLRQELGEDKLGMTLADLGLSPSAALTVQALSKKDVVTVAPQGSQFPAQASMHSSPRRPFGGPVRPNFGLGGHEQDDGSDEEMDAGAPMHHASGIYRTCRRERCLQATRRFAAMLVNTS